MYCDSCRRHGTSPFGSNNSLASLDTLTASAWDPGSPAINPWSGRERINGKQLLKRSRGAKQPNEPERTEWYGEGDTARIKLYHTPFYLHVERHATETGNRKEINIYGTDYMTLSDRGTD
ncbi:hypothetical protein J6590_078529 [Homalodisca vitripennis]|nr:hypothetical protein J6590_078529 [Homalodisca vitripennis]